VTDRKRTPKAHLVARTAGAVLLSLGISEPIAAQAPIQIAERSDVVKAEPGASVRHALFPHTLELPPEGIEVRVRCRVLRRSGRPTECRARGAPPMIAEVALRRAQLFVFDTEALAGKPVREGELSPVLRKISVEIVERIAPADRRDTRFGSTEPVPMGEIVFAALPSLDIAGSLYPTQALRRDAWARVRLSCQVQQDRRLFCIGPRVTETNWDEMPDSVRAEFELGALATASSATLAPTLGDGSDSAGAVVTLGVLFRTGS
jgi:hypothetical protein